MSALFNATNINQGRYFFATAENGEQTLGLEFGTTGGTPNLSTMSVAISGDQGNAVIVNQAPQLIATEFVLGEDALIAGTNSSYFTLSTLTVNLTGVNISTDRIPGTGTACIESYGTNGSLQGFEFLNRGVNGALISTTSVGINNYMSSIGRPGAGAVLGSSGTWLTGAVQASGLISVDEATGGGGRVAFTISDLSGAGGVQAQARWGIGTTTPPTGGDSGSDFALYSYGDAGNFLDAPMTVRRSDGAMAIGNISTIQTLIAPSTYAPVYPASKTNIEFGTEGTTEIIAGSTSNQALYGSSWAPLFSTPLVGLNPVGANFVYINFANALSSASNHVNYKVGFSTSTAYTNCVQTSYLPGGQWSPSDLPAAASPIGHTAIACVLDPDGVNGNGSAMLYVQGQLSDPGAPADQIFIAKGTTSEATRNALVWRPF